MIDYVQPTTERNTVHKDLKDIRSPHFANGGTGITNFGYNCDVKKSAEVYLEAIKRHGDSNYVVSAHPLTGSMRSAAGSPIYSLHYIGVKFPVDSSPFWSVYNQVQLEREAEEKHRQEEEERKKREAECQPCIAKITHNGAVRYQICNLSAEHCQALAEVFSRVGGPPEGRRGKVEEILKQLVAAGFRWDFKNRDKIGSGSIYLS